MKSDTERTVLRGVAALALLVAAPAKADIIYGVNLQVGSTGSVTGYIRTDGFLGTIPPVNFGGTHVMGFVGPTFVSRLCCDDDGTVVYGIGPSRYLHQCVRRGKACCKQDRT